MHIRTLIPFAALLLAALTLVGCEQSKISDESFAKVKVGMSMTELTNIMGSSYTDDTPAAGYNISGGGVGSSAAAPEKVYVFKGKSTKYIVNIKDGKVVQMSKTDM